MCCPDHDSSTLDDLPWYGPKAEVRKYLENVNKDQKVRTASRWVDISS